MRAVLPRHPAWLLNLGRAHYDPVHALQLALVEARYEGRIPDTLVLVEHEPVITLGRRADPQHILAPPELLAAEGITVRPIERGGDVTYHGPGQVVAYPIVHINERGLGASDYMHALEGVVAATLRDYGLESYLREGLIGVWVCGNKIAALGVRIRRGVTFHGLALNVSPDMRHWSYIVPCGITDGGVTSLAAELGVAPPLAEVQGRLAAHWAQAFEAELRDVSLARLTQTGIRIPS